jgi:uroporphyrinogen III methyltransferase/synthase
MDASDGPLAGRAIVVTRSPLQARELVDALAGRGAEVLAFPTIEIADPESFQPLDEAIRNLDVYRWIVFTSANAVERFFARLAEGCRDARALAHAKVAAVGPATAQHLGQHGIRPEYVPEDYRAEGVLAGLCERGVGEGTRVLIPRALEAREILPDTLRERGAIVDVVPTYRTVPGSGDPEVLERLREGSVDAVTFTSSSTVRNFLRLTEGVDLDRVVVASIGPVTSKTARELGLEIGVEARESTIPALVRALEEHYRR